MMPPVKEPLAGLALLVIFGLLLWYNRPIESSRPFDPYIQQQASRIVGDGNAYEAWLWKDPFGFDPAAGSGGAFEAWDQATKGKKPDKQSGEPVKAKKLPDEELQNLTCLVSLEKMISGNKSVKILAPLVKVTPETVENKEMRTRQRYALVAGLIESGYKPLEPGLLHFCSIQENSREYDMRWEHYKYDFEGNSKPDIVVAWINSEIFTAGKKFLDVDETTTDLNLARRNLALKNLLSSEKITKNKLYIFDLNDILAQDRSKQIEKEIKSKKIELLTPAGSERKNLKIKCSNAKNSDSNKSEVMDPEDCEEPAEKPDAEQELNNKKTGSEKLADKLVGELKLRGIKDPSEVIIITEHSSGNTATLASNIRQSIGKYFAEQECIKQACPKQDCVKQECHKSANQTSAANTDGIRNVFYLKGSDGNPKKTGSQNNENQSADKAEQDTVIDLHRPPPLPVGPGQLDYFHRLAGEIRNVHATVDFNKRNSGIRAIFILGSDFNDKLLIIETLRARMPHILILTTNLDAQMLYPEHWRSTRNLVVASHFDLLLREKSKQYQDKDDKNNDDKNKYNKSHFWQRAYQNQFPPFRDSQQTGIFYRSLAIAAGEASSVSESENTSTRIFEVGRNGFIRLDPAEKDRCPDYHPADNTPEQTEWRLGLLLGIAVSLLVFYWVMRPRSGLLTLYLAAGTLTIFAVAFGAVAFGLDTKWSGEPFSFTDGVSLWPSIFICPNHDLI
jgi:hypothetical protein